MLANPSLDVALALCVAGALAGDLERTRAALAVWEDTPDALPPLNPAYQDGRRWRHRRPDEDFDTTARLTPLQAQLVAALQANAARPDAVIARELGCSREYVALWRKRTVGATLPYAA